MGSYMYNRKVDTTNDLKEVTVMIGLHNEEAQTPLYSMASLKFQHLSVRYLVTILKRCPVEKQSLGKFVWFILALVWIK